MSTQPPSLNALRVLFIEQLATIIGKTPTTIRTCATNPKYLHLIPRPWKMPNSRRLCWYEHEVMEWVESQRPAPLAPLRRARGRPTKLEQIQRARLKTKPTAGEDLK